MNMQAIKQKQTKGFTLIELVIVIVLLGILAATALPKFSNLTGQARLAVARGVAGSLGDAASIAYSQWLAQGQPNTTITLQDGTVVQPNTTATVSPGYPEDAVPSGGTPAASANTATVVKCQDLWQNLMQNPPVAAGTGGTPATCPANVTNCFTVTAGGQTCTYTDTDGNVVTYNVGTGAVTSP